MANIVEEFEENRKMESIGQLGCHIFDIHLILS
jgi:hypothetical protein